jgi:hypothetical protein
MPEECNLLVPHRNMSLTYQFHGEGVTEIFLPDQARAVWPMRSMSMRRAPLFALLRHDVVDQLPQLSSPGLLVEYFNVKFDKRRVWS